MKHECGSFYFIFFGGFLVFKYKINKVGPKSWWL